MTTLRVVTPSYRPDIDLFRALHSSVLRYTAETVIHEVVVPAPDAPAFSAIESPRLQVRSVHQYLPMSFISVGLPMRTLGSVTGIDRFRKIQAVNVRRPWPPVRGWILQQLVKLEAAARADTDVVLILDSDVELIARIEASQFVRGNTVRLYASPGAVHRGMTDHVAWQRSARDLLGAALGQAGSYVDDDYVSACVTWDPKLVRAMLNRIALHTRTDWTTAAASTMRFSECMMYGAYVSHCASGDARGFRDSDSRCVSHWDPLPLNDVSARKIFEAVGPEDFAVQIQSTSATSMTLRQNLIEMCRTKVAEAER